LEHISNTNAYNPKTQKFDFLKAPSEQLKSYESKEKYHEWCPFHQSEKMSHFTIFNDSKTAHCFSGQCVAHVTFTIIDLVMIFKFGIAPDQVKNPNLKP